jgi:hypothetical protein
VADDPAANDDPVGDHAVEPVGNDVVGPADIDGVGGDGATAGGGGGNVGTAMPGGGAATASGSSINSTGRSGNCSWNGEVLSSAGGAATGGIEEVAVVESVAGAGAEA